jgi:hypothetical protein
MDWYIFGGGISVAVAWIVGCVVTTDDMGEATVIVGVIFITICEAGAVHPVVVTIKIMAAAITVKTR